MLETLNRIADAIEQFAITTLMMLATLVTVAQVIARYVFNNSMYWSEEFIIYALINMSFLTMGMGIRYSTHIKVEVLYAFSSPRVARVLHLIAALLGILFSAALIYYGCRLSMNTLQMGQLSSSMRVPTGYIYLVIPVASVFMLIRYLLLVADILVGKECTVPQSEIMSD